MKEAKLQRIIEQPATYKVDESSRLDISFGLTASVITVGISLIIVVLKMTLNCYSQYSKMVAHVERTANTLAELHTEQKAAFSSIERDFDRVENSIREIQISLAASQQKLLEMERNLDKLETQVMKNGAAIIHLESELNAVKKI